jgi:hypothetical protein
MIGVQDQLRCIAERSIGRPSLRIVIAIRADDWQLRNFCLEPSCNAGRVRDYREQPLGVQEEWTDQIKDHLFLPRRGKGQATPQLVCRWLCAGRNRDRHE